MSQDENPFLLGLMGNTLASLTRPTLLTSTTSTSRTRWSARFETWARPLSDSEDQKCQNAQNMIRRALDGHVELKGLDIRVFAQGSCRAQARRVILREYACLHFLRVFE